MKSITMTAGITALVGVLLLAACSHPGTEQTSGDAAASGITVPDAAGATAIAAPADAGGSRTRSGPAVPPAKLAPGTAALIRTAELTVEVARGVAVAAQADRAEQIAAAAGGQVFADERTAGTAPTAALTLKVPGASLVSVLGKLAGLGKEKSRRSSTQDVTTQVADVSSRVRSAQASIDRLRILFDRATRVGDVIALESELAQRESDLESLQAQQRALAAQTDLATLTLNLTSADAALAPKHHANAGFVGGLDRGWRAFAAAAGALAAGVGAALPFVGLALLLAAAAAVLRRRTRRSVAPVIAPPEGA
jgi:Domain of unknown function (DUF4349)